MSLDNYFDLTNPYNNILNLSINSDGLFNCSLLDNSTNKKYFGFILATSPQKNRYTLCDVDFQRSATDGKYQPRIIFRRTKADLQDVNLPNNSEKVRIPFESGVDGYRNFWKMIFFLYKFKEEIDFGGFDGEFHVISREQLQEYLNNKDNIEEINKTAQELNLEITQVIKSASTLRLLKNCEAKLQTFIDTQSSETDVQNWIDEDNHKYRKERCMIFGLEYIDFKREGSTSSKRFDLLTRVGLKNVEHVLIELKSPSDDIFEVKNRNTSNGNAQEYYLHSKLSRAIPQILEYKSTLESKPAGDPELIALGLNQKISISKCIIVIGKNNEDTRWKQNRKNLYNSLSSTLEIWTYSDLLNKIRSTMDSINQKS
jgi:hypothetical protein